VIRESLARTAAAEKEYAELKASRDSRLARAAAARAKVVAEGAAAQKLTRRKELLAEQAASDKRCEEIDAEQARLQAKLATTLAEAAEAEARAQAIAEGQLMRRGGINALETLGKCLDIQVDLANMWTGVLNQLVRER
jgi:hypothetical protein